MTPDQPGSAPSKRVSAKVTTFFRWYDLWIGAYWDRHSRTLYVCPLPMLGVAICFRPLVPDRAERETVLRALRVLARVERAGPEQMVVRWLTESECVDELQDLIRDLAAIVGEQT